MSILEGILGKLIGEDKLSAAKMLVIAVQAKEQRTPGHVWADYMFLAACYASAGGNEGIVNHAVEQIKQEFPNYDPTTRFTWKSTGIDDIAPDEALEGNTMYDIFRYRAPLIGKMNQFCEKHPDFQFGDALGKYFPAASNMNLKKNAEDALFDKMVKITEMKNK